MSNQDVDKGKSVTILAWCLLPLPTFVIALRLYVRQCRVGRIFIDDYLMVVAWVCAVLQATFYTIAWTHGLGRHFDTLSPDEMVQAMKYTVLSEPWAILSSMCGRLSFCALLLYIVGTTQSKRRVFLWAIIVTQLVINIAIVIQILAQCGTHTDALWDFSAREHVHCQSPEVQAILGYIQGGINSLCDLLLVILPVVILWNLQMPTAHKIGLGAVLTLSIFACACSITKTILLKDLAKGDLTWYINYINIAVLVENNVVMIAASIPTLRPLVTKSGGSSKGTPRRYTNGSSFWQKGSATHDSKRRQSTFIRSSPGMTLTETSEEHILEPMKLDEDSHITKTTAYHVAYETREQPALTKEDVW